MIKKYSHSDQYLEDQHEQREGDKLQRSVLRGNRSASDGMLYQEQIVIRDVWNIRACAIRPREIRITHLEPLLWRFEDPECKRSYTSEHSEY